MCEVRKARFFRPWKGDGAFDDNTIKLEDSMKIDETLDKNTIDREMNYRIIEKCEDSMNDEEDNDSVLSLISGVTSETGSYRTIRRSSDNNCNENLERRRSVSSSCSINSCEDLPEGGSLDMLSNFVFGTRNEMEASRATTDNSMVNSSCSSSSVSSSSEASSCISSSSISPKSAFTPTSNQHPGYANIEYFSSFGFIENAAAAANVAAAAAASFEAVYGNPCGRQVFYGLPGIAQLGNYANSVEEAVKYIHQQDAAAKQMKKLRPKKFRCEHCDVAFSNNGQLKGHVRIHTGERPFKCDADGCGKSFTRNEELTRHKRIHTGLRPHSCILCGKRFGRKDHLKKHTRTHDNRGAYHIPTSALGPFPINHHALHQGHPIPSYLYPI